MKIRILVAAHKEYRMPDDPVYLPVFVGAALSKALRKKDDQYFSGNQKEAEEGKPAVSGYQPDDEGDNISDLNPFFCELTALYWGWKNMEADYLGLVHYRRHFVSSRKGNIWEHIFSGEDFEKLFGQGYQAVLPRKRHYVIETLYSHYEHTHHKEDLNAAKEVIRDFYPDYSEAFQRVMNRRSAHMFNMCVMEKGILDSYCEWLFDVLFKIRERLDTSSYSDFDKRVFGRISELLLDVWLENNPIRYKEIPVRNTEGEDLVRKVFKVIRGKLKG